MPLKYRTSIYTRPRIAPRPTYRKTTLLDLMRAERKLDEMQDAIGISHQIKFENCTFTDRILYTSW